MYTFSNYWNPFHEAHGGSDLLNEGHFKIPRRCQGKCCTSKKFKPNLNVQTDSVREKLFCLTCNFCCYFHHLLFVLVFIEPEPLFNFVECRGILIQLFNFLNLRIHLRNGLSQFFIVKYCNSITKLAHNEDMCAALNGY